MEATSSDGHIQHFVLAPGGGVSLRASARGLLVGIPTREEPVERTFSEAAARRANLWGKSGPWQQYPERMLQMRARAFALRDVFCDVLRGLGSAEEQGDIPARKPPPKRRRAKGGRRAKTDAGEGQGGPASEATAPWEGDDAEATDAVRTPEEGQTMDAGGTDADTDASRQPAAGMDAAAAGGVIDAPVFPAAASKAQEFKFLISTSRTQKQLEDLGNAIKLQPPDVLPDGHRDQLLQYARAKWATLV